MKRCPLYLLQINGKTVLEISSEDSGVPVKQRINGPWLLRMVSKAIRQHSRRQAQYN